MAKRLESALSDAHIDLMLEKEYLKEVCRAAGIDDVGEFKKNMLPNSSQCLRIP